MVLLPIFYYPPIPKNRSKNALAGNNSLLSHLLCNPY